MTSSESALLDGCGEAAFGEAALDDKLDGVRSTTDALQVSGPKNLSLVISTSESSSSVSVSVECASEDSSPSVKRKFSENKTTDFGSDGSYTIKKYFSPTKPLVEPSSRFTELKQRA